MKDLLPPGRPSGLVVKPRSEPPPAEWTQGVCPNCGFTRADVDREGVLWCPACGYSKKGCFT